MPRVLCYGSLNIDHVYRVPHFVRAKETLTAATHELFPGGKGLNQSIAFSRAGAELSMAGKVGTDGAFLLELLTQANADISRIDQTGSVTGHAIIQVEPDGQNCILVYGGANREQTLTQVRRTLSDFGKGDLLVLQNEINLLPEIIAEAKLRGMSVALNPSPIDDTVRALDLSDISWLIVNEVEGEALSGEHSPKQILKKLLARHPHLKIVLTLGEQGAVYADRNESVGHPVFEAEVVDTTGAGDTFTGYFLTCMLRGGTPTEALRRASAASAIAISRAGAASSIPTAAEVDEFLRDQE